MSDFFFDVVFKCDFLVNCSYCEGGASPVPLFWCWLGMIFQKLCIFSDFLFILRMRSTLLSLIRGRDSHVVGVGHLVVWRICMHVIDYSSLNIALYVAGCRANRQ